MLFRSWHSAFDTLTAVCGTRFSTLCRSSARITVVRNPTAGTIVDNATAVAINQNRNFGSNATLSADVYKGATGNTMTGGNDYLLLYQGLSSRLFATISTDLPRGSSIGIKIDPQTSSNTSLAVYAALICYLRDPKED